MNQTNSPIYWFLIPWFFLLGLASIFVFTTNIGDFVLFINERHTAFGDVLFRSFSFLGNAYTYLFFFLAFLLMGKKKEAKQLVLFFLLTAIVVLLCKEFLFGVNPRPKAYLVDYPLQFVEGVRVHSANACPSGHTSDAFGLAFFLSLLVRNNLFSLSMVLLASAVGLARIYLVQHFLIDVCAGSVMGVMGVIIGLSLYNRFSKNQN